MGADVLEQQIAAMFGMKVGTVLDDLVAVYDDEGVPSPSLSREAADDAVTDAILDVSHIAYVADGPEELWDEELVDAEVFCGAEVGPRVGEGHCNLRYL
jgi:hypothetical protein